MTTIKKQCSSCRHYKRTGKRSGKCSVNPKTIIDKKNGSFGVILHETRSNYYCIYPEEYSEKQIVDKNNK